MITEIQGEVWKQVVGFNAFEVSNFGRIRRNNGGKIIGGTDHNGYRRFTLDRQDDDTTIKALMHRLVFEAHVRELEPGEVIDHIDGDRRNNRVENLRVCKNDENQHNRGGAKQSTSFYKGVSYCQRHKKWRAQIKSQGRSKHIGYFDKESDAAIAYNDVAIRTFGAFAFINKVLQNEQA